MSAMRLGKAVSKAGSVCMEVRNRVNAAGARFPGIYDQIDMVVGAAHQNATKPEIEGMVVALDEAVTEAEVVSRDLQAAVLQLREVRGRLDRAMQSYRQTENARPLVAAAPAPTWVAAPVAAGIPTPPLPTPRNGTFMQTPPVAMPRDDGDDEQSNENEESGARF